MSSKFPVYVMSDVSPDAKNVYKTVQEKGVFKNNKLTGFGKEIHRLEWEHGYRYDPESKQMVNGERAQGLNTLTEKSDYDHQKGVL